MSKRLDFDPFQPFENGASYDQLFDGSSWALTKGSDFKLHPKSLADAIRDEYRRRNGWLQVRTEGDTVYVKTIPPATK